MLTTFRVYGGARWHFAWAWIRTALRLLVEPAETHTITFNNKAMVRIPGATLADVWACALIGLRHLRWGVTFVTDGRPVPTAEWDKMPASKGGAQ